MIFLFCWAAAAVVLGFVFLFMIPLCTAVILALDVPGWLKKWKLFRQESGYAEERELTEAEPGSPQDISVILGSQVVMVCEIKPGPWDYLTRSERQAAADSFRAALAETNQSGVMTQVVLENYHETRNIPGAVSTCPGTLAMLEARNDYWNGMERFQAYYHVVFWGKRQDVVKEAALDFMGRLENQNISYTFLARESILNWMEYQRDPFPDIEEAADPKQLRQRLRERYSGGTNSSGKAGKGLTGTRKKELKAAENTGLRWREPAGTGRTKPARLLALPERRPHIKMPAIPRQTAADAESRLFAEVMRYRSLAVWNPDGYKKADTALELAISFRKAGREAVLLEFDCVNPRLDVLFSIPKPSLEKCYNRDPQEIGAGLLTFGSQITPEIAAQLLYKYRYDILYLPAGNTMGVTDARVMTAEEYEELIKSVRQETRTILIDCPADPSHPGTLAAVRCSEAVIVPQFEDGKYMNENVGRMEKAGINIIKYVPEEEQGRDLCI